MSDWIDACPKVELHLHFEGAVPLDVWHRMALARGAIPQAETLERFERRFQTRSFRGFIKNWLWCCALFRTAGDLRDAARAVACELARQNILYAELYVSPAPFLRAGFALEPLIHGIVEGLASCPQVETRLLIDLARDRGPGAAGRIVDDVIALAHPKVVGIGLGGTEAGFPPDPFAGVFRKARDAGLGLSAHAGEHAGAESIRAAIEKLGATRIGHGIAALGDARLCDRLRDGGIPLEICLSSNLRTGAVSSLADHPAKRLYDAGVPITINSDDPAMFMTSLTRELRLARDLLGLGERDIAAMLALAAARSFAEAPLKKALRQAFGERVTPPRGGRGHPAGRRPGS